jgi:hypothetical protein
MHQHFGQKISHSVYELRCEDIIKKYRVAQKVVNLKRSLVLKGMFRFKPASVFTEQYHSDVHLNGGSDWKHFL